MHQEKVYMGAGRDHAPGEGVHKVLDMDHAPGEGVH